MSGTNPDTGAFTIPANGQVKKVIGVRNYLYCYLQSGLVQVSLYKNNKLVESHNMILKSWLSDKDYDSIIVKDISGSENAVRFFHGVGEYNPPNDQTNVTVDDSTPIDVALSSGSITIDADLSNQHDTIDDVVVSGSVTPLCGINSARIELILTVKPGAPNGLRIGDSGVSATSGAYVGPGETRILKTSAAWFAIRDGASDVSVTMTETEGV